jgi:hypothetical protein
MTNRGKNGKIAAHELHPENVPAYESPADYYDNKKGQAKNT